MSIFIKKNIYQKNVMRRKTLLIFLFVCTLHTYGQKEANIWYFGEYAGLDFNSGSPVFLTDGKLKSIEGCATISNDQGQLLFYTDGITVWNKNHEVMSNGTGLMGGSSSTQSALITQRPDHPNNYYIFTTPAEGHNNGARYTEVDMTLNGGLGDVTSNKNTLLFTPSCEKISASRNATTGEIWVVFHEHASDRFFSYKVTTNGVASTPVISSSGIRLSYDTNLHDGYVEILT